QRNGSTLVAGGLGFTVTAGMTVTLRVEASGASPTTVRAKAWVKGSAEPGVWLVTMTDSSASLQGPGAVGIAAYAGGGLSNTPYLMRFDNLVAVTPGTIVTPPENEAPVAAFTSDTTDLTVNVDAGS